MAEIEQDLKSCPHPCEIPPLLEPLEGAGEKDIIIWDADNTFWDWTRMRTRGVESMAEVVSEQLQIPIEETRKSMGRVFDAAGTFDHPAVIENMDVFLEKMLNEYHGWKKDPEKGVIMVVKLTAMMLWAAGKAYNSNREKHYGLYVDIKTVVQTLHECRTQIDEIRQRVIQQLVFTNAPKNKITPRLKSFGFTPFISAVYTRPPAKVKYDIDKIRYTEKDETLKPMHRRYQEIIKKIGDVDAQIEDRFEPVMRTLGHYTADVPERVLYDIKKPHFLLSQLWNMPQEEISRRVVVIGDSAESDMQFAINNQCAGIHALWGVSSEEDRALLKKYGSESERRNVPDKETTKQVKAEIIKGQHNIVEADDPIQVLDLLGVERPAHLRPKE